AGAVATAPRRSQAISSSGVIDSIRSAHGSSFVNPVPMVSACRQVRSAIAVSASSGTSRPNGRSRSRPSSARRPMAAAVKDFVIDAIRYGTSALAERVGPPRRKIPQARDPPWSDSALASASRKATIASMSGYAPSLTGPLLLADFRPPSHYPRTVDSGGTHLGGRRRSYNGHGSNNPAAARARLGDGTVIVAGHQPDWRDRLRDICQSRNARIAAARARTAAADAADQGRQGRRRVRIAGERAVDDDDADDRHQRDPAADRRAHRLRLRYRARGLPDRR